MSAKLHKSAAQVFAALGDETRLRLVARLCDEGPMSITRLASGARITRQGVTKHLRVMERAKLIRSTRRGRELMWELDQQRVEEARQHLAAIARQWDDALTRLKAFVEA